MMKSGQQKKFNPPLLTSFPFFFLPEKAAQKANNTVQLQARARKQLLRRLVKQQE